MLTKFENSFSVVTAVKDVQNKYNISCHLLKTLLHCRVKRKSLKKVAFALPIFDDKAVPNFYDNFVSC